MKKKVAKTPSGKTARVLLEEHGCPVPFHAVRTRFLGNIATPGLSASPIRIMETEINEAVLSCTHARRRMLEEPTLR